jgi:hypothetical protein
MEKEYCVICNAIGASIHLNIYKIDALAGYVKYTEKEHRIGNRDKRNNVSYCCNSNEFYVCDLCSYGLNVYDKYCSDQYNDNGKHSIFTAAIKYNEQVKDYQKICVENKKKKEEMHKYIKLLEGAIKDKNDELKDFLENLLMEKFHYPKPPKKILDEEKKNKDERRKDLIDKYMESNPGEYYAFDGQNCHDFDNSVKCEGWDGISKRCQCGNRRVSWEIGENGNVYAQAY